jgi:hypothetical protein
MTVQLLKIHIEFVGDRNRIRLHVNEDSQTYQILDDYWSQHYKQGADFPCLGYSAATDSDVYELTVEQLFHVLTQRLGVSVVAGKFTEHRQPKRAVTPAQRAARRLNAEKARNRGSQRRSV